MPKLEHITGEDIEKYGVIAAPDVLSGKPSENKAVFDRLVRELVALVVNRIIDETNLLLEAEDIRTEQESGRVAAEQLRAAAEELRRQGEAAREAAESARTKAETARSAAEQERRAAEEDRRGAEAQREAAEQARADEHTGLVAQATAQADAAAESARQAAESRDAAKHSEQTVAARAEEIVRTASAEARSWAAGGTGTRPGEDTDNAKYYAEQARQIAGAEYALKTEAQGYVDTHDQAKDAHAALFQAERQEAERLAGAALEEAKEYARAYADKPSVSVAFTAAEWSGGTLTIPQAKHGRRSGVFGYQLRHKVGGELLVTTWAVAGTGVKWDESSKTITLTSDDAYEGEITFLG